jgi:hypothetical protein
MLPSLTVGRARLDVRRFAAGLAAFLLLALAAGSALVSAGGDQPSRPAALRDRLAPATWALTVPTAWLATPSRLAPGDRVDLLGVRSGDRPSALPLAADLLVMEADPDRVVFEVDEDAATTIAAARASALVLVPLLRSTR